GFTAIPSTAPGYQQPPVCLPLFCQDRADKLYLAVRSVLELNGQRDSCEHASGQVTVHKFDAAVIGCHVAGKQNCTSAETDFVAGNAMKFKLASASYQMQKMTDAA